MSVGVSATVSAQSWYTGRTFEWRDWPLESLLARKGATRVSVVIPARDEEATIAQIVRGIRSDLMLAHPLVDELVVIDSDSTDRTAQLAAENGAIVYAARSIRPDLPAYAGKGEALWKAQFVTTGDVLVFIDADLTGWGTHFVSGLLGPLLSEPGVQLVRGYYDRVLDDGSSDVSPQGGRVTELVARPLLNLYWPELARVVQPLAGEWAMRRSGFAALSVPVGYGVELASLLDVHATHGLDAIAQVDLGRRAHAHQSVHDLGLMAAELIAVAQRRRDRTDPRDEAMGEPSSADQQLWQFDRTSGWHARAIPGVERPPGATLAGPPAP